MAKHIIATTVLVEVDDEAWANTYGITRERAVEDSETHVPAFISAGLDGTHMHAEQLITSVKVVDLLGWARKMKASTVVGPGSYYMGIEAERESWTDTLIGILTGEEELPE